MSRLYNILNKLAGKALIETGTSNDWTYQKFSDGTMKAWRTVTTGSTWSVVTSGIYQNQTQLTLPSGMTFFAGYASTTVSSTYLIGAQVQNNQNLDTGVVLTVHRLASSVTSFTYQVVIEGTYS